MILELYVEGQLLDIDERLSVQLSYAIDDIKNFGSRETSFSKQIVLPGTKRNDAILGNISDNAIANTHSPAQANIGNNYNVAKVSRAELRMNGMLMLKGAFRLINITKTDSFVEYEAAIFGELGNFVAEISNALLEDLDFSEYNHAYNASGITESWDEVSGSGYYYPLIDYGTYSSGKVDYDIRTFKPALYVKEYIDKIFQKAGYSYESNFFNSDIFKKLIIPYNRKLLEKQSSSLLTATLGATNITDSSPFGVYLLPVIFSSVSTSNFTNTANSYFTWNQPNSQILRLVFNMSGNYSITTWADPAIKISLQLNNNIIGTNVVDLAAGLNQSFNITFTADVTLNQNDVIHIQISAIYDIGTTFTLNIDSASLTAIADAGVIQVVGVNDTVDMNAVIPKGIRQLDFFTWIMKMFNLYIDENRVDDKKLIIEPYKDFFDMSSPQDWTDKIDRSKPIKITPMGLLNGRFFEMKYKSDNDFYNESYTKKYNENYGDRIFDSGFQFSKEKQTVEIGFSATPLVRYEDTDKYVGAIYKKSQGNQVDQEELTDSNIRIMLAKKITGVTSWKIKDGNTDLQTLTSYGYAGHFDDPTAPTVDINFGALIESFAEFDNYTSNNLFNVYWSEYIAEVIDKDSRLMSCNVKLDNLDIYNLDFSRPILIDGQYWRLNKVTDFDPVMIETTQCEFLKIVK